MPSGIYCIRCIKNGKVYIGSAIDLENRWKMHQKHLIKQAHHSVKLQRAWNKYSSKYFHFQVLEYCSRSALLEREQYWIDVEKSYKSGYNSSPTAGSTLGYRFTEEQRKRLSDAHLGHKLSPERLKKLNDAARKAFTGRPLLEETKRKISEALKGKPLSEERKSKLHTPEVAAKISAALKGRTIPEEVRQKISAAQKGRKNSPEAIEKMRATKARRRGPEAAA